MSTSSKIKLKIILKITLSIIFISNISAFICAKNLELYPFSINANLKTKFVSEDNVYVTNTNEKSNYSTIFEPSIAIILNEKNKTKHKFSLNYAPEIVESEITRFSTTRQNINGSLDLNFPIGLSIRTKDTYKITDNPPTSEITEKIKRTENNLKINTEYDSKHKILIGYGYSELKNEYTDAPYKASLSYQDVANSMKISYKMFPKTNLYSEVTLGQINYLDKTTTNDSDYVKYDLGIQGKITPKTNGTISLGSQNKKYTDTSKNENVDTFMYSLSTITNFSKNKKLQLNFQNSTVESIYANNLYYVSNKFTTNFSTKFAKKWELNPSVTYELMYYPKDVVLNNISQKRSDDIISLNLNTNYTLNKYAKLGLEYSFKQRNSNLDTSDYKTNTITCLLIIGF
jgi:hypothetical protein